MKLPAARGGAAFLEGLLLFTMILLMFGWVAWPASQVVGSPAGGTATSPLLVTVPLNGPGIPDRLDAALPGEPTPEEPYPPGTLTFTAVDSGIVRVWDPTFPQWAGLVGPGLMVRGLTLGTLVLLFLVVRSLKRGDPFTLANSRRLLGIAALVGIGGQAALWLHTWGRQLVITDPAVAPYSIDSPDWTDIRPLLVGLAVYVLADVFRRGTRMREDVEGLV